MPGKKYYDDLSSAESSCQDEDEVDVDDFIINKEYNQKFNLARRKICQQNDFDSFINDEKGHEEEEDGFDPGSLQALNYSRPCSVATVSPSPSSPSSKSARKKKKKTPTLQSAKRVRAEYKKKMQNQRQCMQAIPERNLTAIW